MNNYTTAFLVFLMILGILNSTNYRFMNSKLIKIKSKKEDVTPRLVGNTIGTILEFLAYLAGIILLIIF